MNLRPLRYLFEVSQLQEIEDKIKKNIIVNIIMKIDLAMIVSQQIQETYLPRMFLDFSSLSKIIG